MKQFIYLDTDMINSILAQSEKGLVSEIINQQENQKGVKKHKKGSLSTSAKVGGQVLSLIKAEAALTTSGEIMSQSESHILTKQIATKTLHDASFDIIYDALKEETHFSVINQGIGSFMEVKKKFEFVDFEYLKNLFANDGLISYLIKTEEEKVRNELEQNAENELNRSQKRKNGSLIKNEIDKLVKENSKQYEEMPEIIKAIKSIIPYSRMLVSEDGLLIPLEDEFFRDNPNTMSFKHGGEVTCFGYISNIIDNSASQKSSNVFSTLRTTVNQVVTSILPTTGSTIYVVYPIAIYYG